MSVTDLVVTPIVNASGVAVGLLRPDRNRTFTVSQVSIEMPNVPLGGICDLRKNGVMITPLLPSGDAAGGDPPVKLLSSDTLKVTWSSCTPGAVGTVIFIYDDGRG
jgi:hypothetical protein